MLKRKAFSALLMGVLLLPTMAFGQTAVYTVPADVMARIKDEGTKNSQVMKTLNYLTDVIGPRLTGSPGMKRANDWTRDTLASWGLQNAKLESWGPFGRGWTLKRYSAIVEGPVAFPFLSYPKAWSPGTETLTKSKAPFTAEVVHLNARSEADLEAFKGKLRGKIVLVGAVRAVPAWLEAPGRRYTDSELLSLADAPDPNAPRPASSPAPPGPPNNFAQAGQFNARRMRFLQEEGAAVLIDTAGKGDGGTIFVSGASAYPSTTPAAPGSPNLGVRDKNANVPVQVGAAVEHFNRLARMIEAGDRPTMTMDLGVEFQDADMNGYNTVAEIPGSDKADELVMLGAHLDSWHSGTGATDNASGSAVMMEAVRIIQTLGLKPRRTIRIGLWSGEEQGLFGSRAYVRQHFGYRGDGTSGGGGQGQAAQPLTKLPAYDKFSAYYNIDNGTGKIRGIYMQGNEGVRPIFRRWLESFRDPKWYDATNPTNMSAQTLSLANTGGTDHLAFDAVGLPGFQFIQDPMEYSTRTHHSNMDSFDRIQADDVKQMSIIVAALVYQTAMMEERLPRKAVR